MYYALSLHASGDIQVFQTEKNAINEILGDMAHYQEEATVHLSRKNVRVIKKSSEIIYFRHREDMFKELERRLPYLTSEEAEIAIKNRNIKSEMEGYASNLRI